MDQPLVASILEEFVRALSCELRLMFEQLLEQQKQQQPAQREILTQLEVMKLLSIRKPTLMSYQKKGLITPYRIKGVRSPYYKRSEIEKQLKPSKTLNNAN